MVAFGSQTLAEGSRTKVGWEYIKENSVHRLGRNSDLVDWCGAGVRAGVYGLLELVPMATGLVNPRRYRLETSSEPVFREPFEGIRDVVGNVRHLNIPGLLGNAADLPDRFVAKPLLSFLPGNPQHGGRRVVITPSHH